MLPFMIFSISSIALYNYLSEAARIQPLSRIERYNNMTTQKSCTTLYQSFCSLGDSFPNQIFGPHYSQAITPGLNRRKKAHYHMRENVLLLTDELRDLRNTLFKEMSDDTFLRWNIFLAKLIDITEATKTRNENLGFCSEATKASVTQSIWRQLETGTRESIQFIGLMGRSPIFADANHNLVIYNAKPIPTQNINNEELKKLLQNLSADDPKHAVVICDSWVDFHGDAKQWPEHYVQNANPPFSLATWNKIKVDDLTIPSLRDGITAKQRQYLKNKMHVILSHAIQRPVDRKFVLI